MTFFYFLVQDSCGSLVNIKIAIAFGTGFANRMIALASPIAPRAVAKLIACGGERRGASPLGLRSIGCLLNEYAQDA